MRQAQGASHAPTLWSLINGPPRGGLTLQLAVRFIGEPATIVQATYEAPGVFRARSETRTSDNGDRTERRPAKKYCSAFFRAQAHRVLASQRAFRREAIAEQRFWSSCLWEVQLRSQLGLPDRGQPWAREAVGARRNAVSDQLMRLRGGLVGHFRRFAIQEQTEDPLRKLTFVSNTSYFRRMAGRFLYVVATDLPFVAAIPTLFTTWQSLSRGMCPCGQHVLAYGLCVNYWNRATRTYVQYLVEILTYARTNQAHDEVLFQILDVAREVNFKNDRGTKLVRQSLRKTASNTLPLLRQVKLGAGFISDVAYIFTGHSMQVNATLSRSDDLGLIPVGWEDVDEIAWFLTLSNGIGVRLPRILFEELPRVFGDAFTLGDLESFCDEMDEDIGFFDVRGRKAFSSWLSERRTTPLPRVPLWHRVGPKPREESEGTQARYVRNAQGKWVENTWQNRWFSK